MHSRTYGAPRSTAWEVLMVRIAHQGHQWTSRRRDREKTMFVKYICSSVHRNSKLKKSNKMQQYADIYLLLNCSTCFGRPSRPSSEIHKTVVAASATDHTIWETSFFKHDQTRSPYLITFEETSFPHSTICTRGCNYSFMYSWWWARWTPETRRVI